MKKFKDFITEERYYDKNDDYHLDRSAHPSQKRTPDLVKVKHDFKVGDKVKIKDKNHQMHRNIGVVERHTDEHVHVSKINIYYPKQVYKFHHSELEKQ